jgi:hypothetical protein
VPHAFYTDSAVAAADLAAHNADCKPTDDATWRACANAIHLRCRTGGCWTTGVGPLEWGAQDASTLACLKTDPPREVADDDLLRFGGCPTGAGAGAAARFQCARAVHEYCVSLGFATGLGPVDQPSPGRWKVVCLPRSRVTILSTSYRALARHHDLCTGLDAVRNTPSYCMGAAKRYCIHEGHVAGFGPVADPDGKSPLIVCLDG